MKEKNLPIKRKLQRHLIIVMVSYAVLGFCGILFIQFPLNLIENRIGRWIYLRWDLMFYAYLFIGFMIIILYFWEKPWDYFNEIVKGTQIIYEQNDQMIKLSDPLYEIERQMNQIKMTVLLNEQAAREAEDKKNELVMSLAHDIRTPLTTVIGYLSLLGEEADMSPEQREKYTGIALDKAGRLEELINELFEITQYHVETVPLKKETVDLYCLLVQLVDEFYPALSARGNTLRFEGDEELKLIADPEKLARALGNILKNAASYSYPDTEIVVTAKRSADNAIISVEDHGETIPKDKIESIFEKYNRLDAARTSNTGGAGLGLAIAREIIHLHDGSISAASGDETVTITVTLPLMR